jgi:integrase
MGGKNRVSLYKAPKNQLIVVSDVLGDSKSSADAPRSIYNIRELEASVISYGEEKGDSSLFNKNNIKRLDAHLSSHNLGEKTRKTTIRAVVDIIKNYGITEPSQSNAEKLKNRMVARSRKANTVRLYLIALRHWARSQNRDILIVSEKKKRTNKYKDAVAMPHLDEPDPNSKVIDPVTRSRLLHDTEMCLRDKAIFWVLFSTGMRPGEAASLTMDCILHDTKRLHVKHTKTQRDRIVSLTDEAYSNLMGYVAERNMWLAQNGYSSEHVFVVREGKPISADSIRQIWYRTKKRLHIEGRFYPYRARHTAITAMANIPGNNLRDVQKQVGQRSLEVLEHYLATDVNAFQKRMNEGMDY